jgi:hypothetical protein
LHSRERVKNLIVEYEQLVQSATENAKSPYLFKNLVLLIASTEKPGWEDVIRKELGKNGSNCLVVHDAVQFALQQRGHIFDVEEPDIIESYYSSWYPVLPVQLSSLSG